MPRTGAAEEKSAAVVNAEAQGFRSDYRGVRWENSRRWFAQISHNGKFHRLGHFDDEQEAARAFDTAARRLRSQGEAHGGRSGTYWHRLNFPTAEEEAFAVQQGMPGSGAVEEKSAVVTKAEAQGFRSDYLGVTWPKGRRQWNVTIKHNGKQHSLGHFDDEQEAARAYDTAARRLRPKGEAHGGRSGTKWKCLNFPTAEERAFAEGAGMEPPKKKQKVKA
jgi:hypothetical protein